MDKQHHTRRRFLLAATGLTAAVRPEHALLTDRALPAPETSIEAITPVEQFFRQQVHATPQLSPALTVLRIDGQVSRSLTLPYADLLARPSVELTAAIACIGSTPSQPLIGSARWRGLLLSDLLAEAGIQPNTAYAQFTSADGYGTSLELDALTDALLATHMNDDILLSQHGFPLRLIVPGRYGYKMPKWITGIALADSPTPGFWETRGWSASGVVQTTSAILRPRHLEVVTGPVHLAGFAYAGTRAITRVEVSADDGPWMPVIHRPVAPASWTLWQIIWQPPAPGDYLLKVRAADSAGFIQPDSAPVFPNGSTAAAAIVVRVTA